MSGCGPCGNGGGDDEGAVEVNSQHGLPLNYLVNSQPVSTDIPHGYQVPKCITPPAQTSMVHASPFPGPTPYYQQVSLCPEDNTKVVNHMLFSTVIKSSSAFNMPACGGLAQVKFEGLTEVALYSQIWAYGVGFLTVTAFDKATNTVTLRNECNETCGAQLAVGTLIAKCTPFVVAPPACSPATSGVTTAFPYLAVQFTAPANGNCLDITVTNTNGLSVGKAIQINGGTYLLDAIISSTVIRICNAGQGLPAGTVVNAVDAGGTYITPIVLVDQNPCTTSTVTTGKMMVCKDNILRPLAGALDGQIPVYNAGSGEVSFQSLGIDTVECTTLQFDFTVDPSNPPGTQYLVTVASSALFAPGDVAFIGTQSFDVNSIPDATHLYLVPNPVPGSATTFTGGSQVCEATCCVNLGKRIDALDACIGLDLADVSQGHAYKFGFGNTGVEDNNSAGADITLPQNVPSGGFIGTTGGGITLINSSCRDLAIYFTILGQVNGEAVNANSGVCHYQFNLVRIMNHTPPRTGAEINQYAGPPDGATGVAAISEDIYTRNDSPHAADRQRIWAHNTVLAPGEQVVISAAMQVHHVNGPGDYNVHTIGYLVEGIAVAA